MNAHAEPIADCTIVVLTEGADGSILLHFARARPLPRQSVAICDAANVVGGLGTAAIVLTTIVSGGELCPDCRRIATELRGMRVEVPPPCCAGFACCGDHDRDCQAGS